MEAVAPSRRVSWRVAVPVALALALVALGAVGPKAEAGMVRLPVRHCRTELPFPGHGPRQGRVPATRYPSSLGAAHLAVYADRLGSTVIGPRGWRCGAWEGVDGTEVMTVARTVVKDVTSEHPREAVSLTKIPACAGCMAEQLCAIFPEAPPVRVYGSSLECPARSPDERVRVIGRWTATFEDPPGVEGQGLPSGGPNPAVGRLSYRRRRGFAQITCVLSPDRAQTCRRIAAAGIRAWER